MCAVQHSNHFATWPQNFRPAHRRGLLLQEVVVGLSAWRQSVVEEEFARVADTCQNVDVSTHAVEDNDLGLRTSTFCSKSLRYAVRPCC